MSGGTSGSRSARERCRKPALAHRIGEARRTDILQQVKQFGLEHKRLLTEEEFAGIVRRIGSTAD